MRARGSVAALGWGTGIGVLGGLVGLGGAEFRLPVLLGVFRFRPIEAVILNKAMSLVVVAAALLFRARSVPFSELGAHWTVVADLLAGSLLGAWLGADRATRLRGDTFYRVIAILLALVACVMLLGHQAATATVLGEPTPTQYAVGIVAGFAIGVIAALLDVAGGSSSFRLSCCSSASM